MERRKYIIIMTRLILSITLLLFVSNSFAQDKGVDFFKGSWEEVLAESKKTGKPIFVDAYAVWCGPCKWMSSNVFTRQDVGEFYNANYVNYKFDMERGEGRIFANKYKVTAYPTLFFLDSDGKVVHRVLGAKNVEQFLQEGRKAIAYFE